MQLIQHSEYLKKDGIVSLKISSTNDSKFQSPSTRVVLVIDISGSMSSQVVSKSQDGDVETAGFNQLDLVKHASHTILENLREIDSIAIVAFSTNARIIVPMTLVTQDSKKKIKDLINLLKPEASTNIWDGLYQGMELLRTSPSIDGLSNDSIFLLTDGQPNVHPPRGYMPTLETYLDEHKLSFTVNTFGFGYSLDCNLLNNIAIRCNGHYGFIPDGNFVGTVFVNTMANLLTVNARNITLNLAFEGNNKPDFSECPFPLIKTNWGYQIQIGTFRFGQDKIITFPLERDLEIEHFMQSNLTYQNFESPDEQESIHFGVSEIETSSEGVTNNFRILFVNLLNRLTTCDNIQENLLSIQRLLKDMTNSEFASNPYLNGLITDLSGQVTEACSRSDWYTRWGIYYMKSLQDAHLHQHCNNFKDPGVANYGGQDFKRLQKQLEQTFLDLPAPEPSSTSSNFRGVNFVRSKSMGKHYSSQNPCWLPDSKVYITDKQTINIQDIKKGQLVKCNIKGYTTVVCLVETKVNRNIEFVELPDPDGKGLCRITPWHPVWNSKTSSWMFPYDLVQSGIGKIVTEYVTSVYNLVLESNHSVLIDGWSGITLGHGASGAVLNHSYLGTDAVIRDLMNLEGWDKGHVILTNKQIIRHDNNSLISKFISMIW